MTDKILLLLLRLCNIFSKRAASPYGDIEESLKMAVDAQLISFYTRT
jgi:hypothetical protein